MDIGRRRLVWWWTSRQASYRVAASSTCDGLWVTLEDDLDPAWHRGDRLTATTIVDQAGDQAHAGLALWIVRNLAWLGCTP